MSLRGESIQLGEAILWEFGKLVAPFCAWRWIARILTSCDVLMEAILAKDALRWRVGDRGEVGLRRGCESVEFPIWEASESAMII